LGEIELSGGACREMNILFEREGALGEIELSGGACREMNILNFLRIGA